MKFVKSFNQKHYNIYLEKIEPFIGNNTSVNQWVKNFTNKELNIWLYLIKILESDSNEYYEEYSILLTILIKFFIIELDVNGESIKLNNKEIINLVNKFKYIIYREYSNRNKITNYVDEEYFLYK